jgi:hypothetical protein
MLQHYRDSYVAKYSSPFAAYLDDGEEVCGWGNATDGPAYVSWVGGRHVLIHQSSGFVQHLHLPAWDGWRYTDRPAKGADVNGAYVWHWIEAEMPDVAAWELGEDEADARDGEDDTEADEALHVTMTLEALGTGTMTGTDRALMNKYRVTLTDQNGNTLQVPFYTGLGWTTDPTIGDVLQCLASDLSVETPEDAEELELGIRAWIELEAQNDRVRAFFGDRVDVLLQFEADDRYAAAATGTEVTL